VFSLLPPLLRPLLPPLLPPSPSFPFLLSTLLLPVYIVERSICWTNIAGSLSTNIPFSFSSTHPSSIVLVVAPPLFANASLATEGKDVEEDEDEDEDEDDAERGGRGEGGRGEGA
jgi:hypothetical protein